MTTERENMNRNIKAIVDCDPKVAALAERLGLRLFWRDGVLWADDVQLTFAVWVRNGVHEQIETVEQQAEIACYMLGLIDTARRKWPSPLKRAKRMINKFQRDVVKAHAMRRMHFTICRDNSLDTVSVFGGAHYVHDVEVELHLVGEERIQGRGPDLQAATNDLYEKAVAHFKGRRPWRRWGCSHEEQD